MKNRPGRGSQLLTGFDKILCDSIQFLPQEQGFYPITLISEETGGGKSTIAMLLGNFLLRIERLRSMTGVPEMFFFYPQYGPSGELSRILDAQLLLYPIAIGADCFNAKVHSGCNFSGSKS